MYRKMIAETFFFFFFARKLWKDAWRIPFYQVKRMTENTKSIWFKVKEIPLEIQKNKSESLCPRETTQNHKRAVDMMKFAQSLCHPDRKTKQNKKTNPQFFGQIDNE